MTSNQDRVFLNLATLSSPSVVGWRSIHRMEGRKAVQRARMIEWLDAIYADLEELSVLWMKIMSDMESAKAQESKAALEILYSRGFADNLHLQKRLFGRLQQFYCSATEVLCVRGPVIHYPRPIESISFLILVRCWLRDLKLGG